MQVVNYSGGTTAVPVDIINWNGIHNSIPIVDYCLTSPNQFTRLSHHIFHVSLQKSNKLCCHWHGHHWNANVYPLDRSIDLLEREFESRRWFGHIVEHCFCCFSRDRMLYLNHFFNQFSNCGICFRKYFKSQFLPRICGSSSGSQLQSKSLKDSVPIIEMLNVSKNQPVILFIWHEYLASL